MTVDAQIVKSTQYYRIDDDYYDWYADCPYCKTRNNLGGDCDTKEAIEKRELFICGKCEKVFYVRSEID